MVQAEKPRISVIMPAYNAQACIAKAIRSVQEQTVCDWELIVIDDCSKDGTAQVVEEFTREDPRVQLHRNEQNMGVARTRNRGLKLSRGEFVAFLDSDDAWRPEKLAMQLSCFQQTGADLVYTSYAIVDADGKQQCDDFLVPETVSFEELLKENVIGCSTVMLPMKVMERTAFSEDFFHEDYVLWLQLLCSGRKAVGITNVLVDYYFHLDSKAGNKQKAAQKRWKIYRDYLRFSTLKSAWYFVQYALAGLRKYKRV